MLSQRILEWNGHYSNRHGTRPLLYVRPTPDWMGAIRKQEYVIPVAIDGTGDVYDGLRVLATCAPVQDVIGHRPNYQARSGYIALILQTPWHGYPLQNGTVATAK